MGFWENIFITTKAKLLEGLSGSAPQWLIALLSNIITIASIILLFSLLFGIVTVIERKLLGRMQNRFGPNRVGPYGFLQFVADGIKALTKEDIVPARADKIVHFLAPIIIVVPALLNFAVIPFGKNMVAFDMSNGLLFFFAIGAATELAVFMAGWSSRNKYSLLGAMRAIAQMLSYEIPLIVSASAVIMFTGTLSFSKIAEAQSGYSAGFIPNWNILTPWGIASFIIFMIATTAELNRSPFDLPEGESEIVAGYYIEYSGFKFALFFLGEYFAMFAISGVTITLFLGGWNAPLPFLEFLPSWFWFFSKLFLMIFLFIWLRATLPRLRIDQLMNFSWKFLIPASFVTLLSVALWRYLNGGVIGWLICSFIVAIPYLIFNKKMRSYTNEVYYRQNPN
jgi:NADH-quinone oxidoreductase subunit H